MKLSTAYGHMGIERNYLIDNIKGLAIFLVVWGHSIQYLGGKDYDFFDNRVFSILYSFHMPLFIFISGYLFKNTPRKKKLGVILRAKFQELIIPIFLWNVIFTVVFYGKRLVIQLAPESFQYILEMYWNFFPYYLWFFWTLFICIVLTSLLAKLFTNKTWAFLLSVLVLLAIPDFSNIKYVKYLFPYFIAGYVYCRYAQQIARYRFLLTAVCTLLVLIGVVSWNRDFFIYNTGFPFYTTSDLDELIHIVAIRYLTGFAGTYLFISAVGKSKILRRSSWLSFIGVNTYGIYILQTVLLPIISKLVRLNPDNYFTYNFVYTPAIAIIAIILCLAFSKAISINKLAHKFLLGAR